MSAAAHRCGTVALLGRPNAGKSSLMNALLGEKLAITAARAQTTRGSLLGIDTRPQAQILWMDTPGVNRGQARFNLGLTERALLTAEDADLRILLLDVRAEWDEPEERIAALRPPILLVRTKSDLASAPRPVHGPERFTHTLSCSATSGAGLDELVERVVALLPEGPSLYPDDVLTDAPMRFLAAEQIREVVFESYRDEVPYGVAVEVESYKTDGGELRVRANLLVEREALKAIVVGTDGRMLKRVGSEARRRLAERVGMPAHLNLWVKTDANWSRRPKRARQLGYL